jgi:hypothetical protein
MAWTNDNWWVGPSAEQIDRVAEREGITKLAAATRLLDQREKWIEAVAADPYRMGFEPSIWWVAWALHDFPWCQDSTRKYLAGRLGVDEEKAWEEWRRRLCALLGVPESVVDLLIMGANRSAKSEFGAKSTQRVAANTPDETVLFLAQQFALSQQTVQPRLWRYMPVEWQKKHMSEDWYVNYKELKGFSEAQYQLPNRTKVIGKFYSQDPKEALVGSETVWAWPDEEITPSWNDELGRRLASRRGKKLLTFTPISGYTAVVKEFLDGARIVKSVPAYMLPRDGGEQIPWLAVGLTREEWEKRKQEMREKRVATVPASRPEDCVAWLDNAPSVVPEEAKGRDFERAPRVALCFDPRKAVVWFQCQDNPYGEPSELIARERDKGADRVRTVLYGIATKSRSSVLARYNELVHVIPDDKVPAVGINYVFDDPSGTRNDALIWIRSTPTADYIYREWPGSYTIPGVGVPGPWARPSGRNKGWNDGDRDEGSESFGFGFSRMKFEVARLERWKAYQEWAKDQNPIDIAEGIGLPDDEELEDWTEAGAEEPIRDRFMDSRAAARHAMTNAGEITLLDQWNNLGGWDWNTTPGERIEEGVKMIADALDYMQARDGTMERAPKLYFAESCRNSRFAAATYTGGDKQKGAVKDWIDMIRYFYQLKLNLCAGVDPAELARVFGAGAKGAAQLVRVIRRGAGGSNSVGYEIRGAGGAGVMTDVPCRVAAGGVRIGSNGVRTGARMVWCGRRR